MAPEVAPGPVAIPHERVLARVAGLADQISADHPRGVTLVAMFPEARRFASDLAAELEAPCRLDRLELAPYRAGERAGLVRDVEGPLKGRAVVLVTAVVDTGLRLRFVLDALRGRRPASVQACVLLDRRERRLCEDLPLDYVGFRAPDALFVGYGLGVARDLDYLPDLRYADDATAARIRRQRGFGADAAASA